VREREKTQPEDEEVDVLVPALAKVEVPYPRKEVGGDVVLHVFTMLGRNASSSTARSSFAKAAGTLPHASSKTQPCQEALAWR
jgi:hypothetical protein